MNPKPFIDTNIWIYAHLETDDVKSNQALALLDSLPELIISTQVLNEYYAVMLKYKIADDIIQDNINVIIEASEVTLIEISTIQLAHKIRLENGFSYWDSLMIASAIENNCTILYSEDMQHLQKIQNLTIINPFVTG
jgi:predicted nucleic acid-binding protein